MLILEKPYVSDLLIEYAEKNDIPVLRNSMSEKLNEQGHNLMLLDDQSFTNLYFQTNRIYTMSENALNWVYGNLSSSDLVQKIELLKDKSKFRKICSSIYPDFFYKELNVGDIYYISVSELRFPLVLKPTIGFLSAGVYIIRTEKDWYDALADIRQNFDVKSSQFPDYVIGSEKFLLEEYIKGEEYAVDAFFDNEGKPVILNIFHHRFVSETDVSDRLYSTSKALYDKYLDKFMDFLNQINRLLKLHDFPMHIEFRCDEDRVAPIEINPLRFAGFCLNELQVYISGIHPVAAYLENVHPDYEAMWRGKESDVFSFVVLERPALNREVRLNERKLNETFSSILNIRRIQNPSVGVFATLFIKTNADSEAELDSALNLTDYYL